MENQDNQLDIGLGDEIKSDDAITIAGRDKYPVFNVSKEEFFNSQKQPKNKMRFDSESKLTNFLKNSPKNNQPFYIRYTDKDTNKQYQRIIK